jgi:hypothetical protein
MRWSYFLIGLAFFMYGIWAAMRLYRQKEEEKTPFDISFGIGAFSSLLGGIWLIVKSFQ